ncbi:Regulatory protein GAL4-like protein [Elsinoe fawcettii]|nr:Regulatory protein GAL4-like protein [Elsinoe fawcettii]
MTEHLSCDVCRRSKLRCTKDKPKCARCRVTGSDCTYSERKKRKARTRKPLDKLLERLEKLESHISSGKPQAPPIHTRSTSASNEVLDQSASPDTPITDPPLGDAGYLPDVVDLPDFSNDLSIPSLVPTPISCASPFSPAATDESSNAIALPKNVAERWLKKALEVTFFEAFLGLVDYDVIKVMPGIVDSPHVSFDPSMKIVYWFLIFQGWTMEDGAQVQYRSWGSKVYKYCLRLAQDWSKKETASGLDFTAAILLSWIATENFDRRSAWKAHCQACQLAMKMGLNEYENSPEAKEDSQDLADSKRVLFWQLLFSECMFRIFFQKPAVITAKPWRVDLPSASLAAIEEKKEACLATSFIVCSRLTLIVLQSFDILDNENLTIGQAREGVARSVKEVASVLADWKISESIQIAASSIERWVYADSYIYGHSLIVFWERKLGELSHAGPSQVAVESSRAVLHTILKVTEMDAMTTDFDMMYSGSVSLISFYPMLAFFHLYNLILLDADGETSELDSKLLESFAHIMVEGVRARGLDDVMPFAESILQMSKEGRIGTASPGINLS